MKRCYFIGLSFIYDSDLIHKIANKLDVIIQSEEKIEFWFTNAHFSYLASCLCLANWYKAKYPEKDIKIVRVSDLPEAENSYDWYHNSFNTSFPNCIPDQNLYISEVCKDTAEFSQMLKSFKKVERWILQQCDTIIAYYYPNLDDIVNKQIAYAQKIKGKNIIDVSCENTKQFIQEQIENWSDERTKKIMTMLNEGKTKSEISKIVGISITRVSQIVINTTKEIRHRIFKHNNPRSQEMEIRRCGIAFLNNSSIMQNIVFDSLLNYIIKTYNVREFWIDEKIYDTTYGINLVKLCNTYRDLNAKVFVCMSKDEYEAFDKRKYMPMYSSVINIDAETTDFSEIYGAVIRQCNCFITDFTNPNAKIIRSLCQIGDGTCLFDISDEKCKMDNKKEVHII